MKHEIGMKFAHVFFFKKRLAPLCLETRRNIYFFRNFQWLINRPKTSAAEAEGRLHQKLRNRLIMFGFGHSLT